METMRKKKAGDSDQCHRKLKWVAHILVKRWKQCGCITSMKQQKKKSNENSEYNRAHNRTALGTRAPNKAKL